VPINGRDVPLTDPDRGAIEFLSRHDVIYGYPDGTFLPDANITRGEILKIALEASGEGHAAFLTKTTGAGRFAYVPASHTLSAYIAYATDQVYISGYPDGTFRPDAQVTRAEAAKIIVKVLHAPGAMQQSPYSDLDGSTLAPFVNAVYGMNWFQPPLPKFNPNIPATRREVARIAYRALIAQAAAPGQAYADTMTEPTSIASDWQMGSQNGLSFDYPAGWIVESDQQELAGKTVSLAATGPDPNADNPVFALVVTDLPDFNSFEETQPEGQFSDPILREFAIDSADGQRTARVAEFREVSRGVRMDGWVTGGKLYLALYFENEAPGLAGTFDRFVQHAIDLNGAGT
jgi:hypothetical protein